MKNIRFLHGKRWHAPQKNAVFDSEDYGKQERITAAIYELTSILLQIGLIYKVAPVMPLPLFVSVTACVIGEVILRANIQAAARVFLAKKDIGKKDNEIKGRRIILNESWRLVVIKAAAWVFVWGCVGYLTQKKDFDRGIGKVEYTQSERLKLEQATEQFRIDSTKAAALLAQEKNTIKTDINSRNSDKVTSKQNQITAAQNAIKQAIAQKDVQGEVMARQRLVTAQSISVSTQKVDYTQVENDYKIRLSDASQTLAQVEKDVLESANERSGERTSTHNFELILFLGLVLVVVVCVFMVEQYKKLSDLDHFGIESIFYKKEKIFQENESVFVTIYEEIERDGKIEVFERLGLTEGALKSAKSRNSHLIEQAKVRCNEAGYDLYFKEGSNYPYLRKIKRKRA